LFTIQSDALRVTINPVGAELWSIFSTKTNREYLWQGDPAWWAGRAPVLFPILCGLRDNAYTYKGIRYEMPKHGFARRETFNAVAHEKDEILLNYTDNEKTRAVYPWAFNFHIGYQLARNTLRQTYHVANTGGDTMYFSIGAHEGFNTDWENGGAFEDYYLEFDTAGDYHSEIITKEGLIDGATYPVIENGHVLPLRHSLFDNDALVFRHVPSRRVFLRSKKCPTAIEYDWQNAPHLGIWQKPGASYVCIEPWFGLPDEAAHNGDIEKKFGIIALPAGEEWVWEHTITIHE
jgi:galactose mutarotase-like enzyme